MTGKFAPGVLCIVRRAEGNRFPKGTGMHKASEVAWAQVNGTVVMLVAPSAKVPDGWHIKLARPVESARGDGRGKVFSFVALTEVVMNKINLIPISDPDQSLETEDCDTKELSKA